MPTKIPWTDETWNFLGGCSPCSPGCLNCAAARLAAGRLKNHPLYKGLTKNGKWTGEVRLWSDIKRSDILEKPLRWKEPRRIFPCFMGDLFHPKVEIGYLTHVFDVIEQCPQHTFQILTKRPEQALKMMWGKHGEGWRYFGDGDYHPNIHFGVSISTQAEADEKIPILLQIPAAVRWLSIEPMLEGIDIKKYVWVRQKCVGQKGCGFTGASYEFNNPKRKGAYRCPQCGKNHTYLCTDSLDWVVYGCESGPKTKRRPFELEWVRDGVRQCKAAGVAVFVKQIDTRELRPFGVLGNKVSRNPEEWPPDLRVQEYPK